MTIYKKIVEQLETHGDERQFDFYNRSHKVTKLIFISSTWYHNGATLYLLLRFTTLMVVHSQFSSIYLLLRLATKMESPYIFFLRFATKAVVHSQFPSIYLLLRFFTIIVPPYILLLRFSPCLCSILMRF